MAKSKGKTYTNTSAGLRGAYLDGELVWAEPGQTIEADDADENWFTAGEVDVAGDDEGDDQTDLIKQAIGTLDADQDDDWTKDGKPAVDAVSEAVGRVVTRADIDAAAPDARRPDPEPK